MDPLRNVRVFAKVAEEGCLARAARALDMPPPVVTRLLAELEARLSALLLNRSTRALALIEVDEN